MLSRNHLWTTEKKKFIEAKYDIISFQRKLTSLDPEKRVQLEKKSQPKESTPTKKEENNSNGHTNNGNSVANNKPVVANSKPVITKKVEKVAEPESVAVKPKPLRTFQGKFYIVYLTFFCLN